MLLFWTADRTFIPSDIVTFLVSSLTSFGLPHATSYGLAPGLSILDFINFVLSSMLRVRIWLLNDAMFLLTVIHSYLDVAGYGVSPFMIVTLVLSATYIVGEV